MADDLRAGIEALIAAGRWEVAEDRRIADKMHQDHSKVILWQRADVTERLCDALALLAAHPVQDEGAERPGLDRRAILGDLEIWLSHLRMDTDADQAITDKFVGLLHRLAAVTPAPVQVTTAEAIVESVLAYCDLGFANPAGVQVLIRAMQDAEKRAAVSDRPEVNRND